jgi:hypothetical protein
VACLPAVSAAGQTPVVLSVARFGAVGNGAADDTDAIQAAVDALPPGGTLRFPPLVYRIAGDRGIRLKDRIRLELGGATLVAANVDGARCRLFLLQGTRDVLISGGTLAGSRLGAPEWGVGILASDAEDLVIQGVTLRGFFTDGILITGNRGCRRVTLRNVLSESNRRSALSVVAASGVRVEFGTFRGSEGQSPEAGINVEPNTNGEVRDVRIVGSTIVGNRGVGLYVHRGLGRVVAGAVVENALVRDNDQGIVADGVTDLVLQGNRVFAHAGPSRSGIALGARTTGRVAGNRVEGNRRGIVSIGASNVTIEANQVTGLGPTRAPAEDSEGIVCRGLTTHLPHACVVRGNRVSRVAGAGIFTLLVARVRVDGNVVEDVGQRGILLRYTTYSEVTGNEVARASLLEPRVYNAIEVTHASHYNVVTRNTLRLGPTERGPTAVGDGCLGNQVFGNPTVTAAAE